MNLSIELDGVIVPTGGFYGVVRQFLGILKKDPTALLFLAHEGFSKEKKETFDGYKEGRTVLDLNQYRKAIYDVMLSHPRVALVRNDEYEADDMVAVVCARLPEHYNKVIMSKDDDFLQCLTIPNTIIMIDSKETRREAYIITKFGVTADKILLYRILKGDTSDRIPSILGRRYREIDEIIQKEVTYKNLLANITRYPFLLEVQEEIHRNIKLTVLPTKDSSIQYEVTSMTSTYEKAMEAINYYKCPSLIGLYKEVMPKAAI